MQVTYISIVREKGGDRERRRGRKKRRGREGMEEKELKKNI